MAAYRLENQTSDDQADVGGYIGEAASMSGLQNVSSVDARTIRNRTDSTSSSSDIDEPDYSHSLGRKGGFSPKEQSARFNLRIQMQKAVEAASHLVDAAEAADPIEMSIAGTTVIDALSLAVNFKSVRERTWFQALTVIHGALALCEFDRINVEAAQAVKKCVEMLSHAGIDRTDLVSIRSSLRKNGIDPWGPISMSSDEKKDGRDSVPTEGGSE